MSKVMIVCASNNKNMALAQSIRDRVTRLGAESEILDLVAMALPLYTPESAKDGLPTAVTERLASLIETQHYIFVAPEYNGGVPPTLTNFMAWVSQASEDWRLCFNTKGAAIATFSGGGGLHVLAAMRQQLSYIGMTVIGRQIQANYQKPVKDESIDDVVGQLLKLS